MATKAFISYRGRDHQLADSLAQRLVDSGFASRAVLVPPNRLCEANELLLPFEYHELMEFIVDEMRGCTRFVTLDTGDYWQSYWTQAEVGHWRRLHQRPVIHRATSGPYGELTIDRGTALQSLRTSERRLQNRYSDMTNRRHQRSTRTLTYTGRYAKSCFLVPCPSCGSHFLASQKAVRSAIGSAIRCPICAAPLGVEEKPRRGTFYRRPVVLVGRSGPVVPVDDGTLRELLVSDDLPTDVHLVKLTDEKFDTDAMKVLKATGWIGAAALGDVLLWNALNDDQ